MTEMPALLQNLRKNPIKAGWDLLSPLPLGRRLFTTAVGIAAPYSSTIGARVVELREGYCRVVLHEHRAVRQHLGSVHAIALANLGELATGLAMYYTLPEGARGIVTRFEMRYHKKARGTLTAECHTDPITSIEDHVEELTAEIRDAAGDKVATATAYWLIRPRA